MTGFLGKKLCLVCFFLQQQNWTSRAFGMEHSGLIWGGPQHHQCGVTQLESI